MEFKVIQNITPLVEDKRKFREWNEKFINALSQVDPAYEKTLEGVMKWAEAEVMPDMEAGWPSDMLETEATEGRDYFAADFHNILSEEPEIVMSAPHTTVVRMVDEGWAARNLILRHPDSTSG